MIVKGMMLLKKKKDKTNSIIRNISYCIAVIIIIYTIKVGNDYEKLFMKIGAIAAIILIIIATIVGSYKLVKYIKSKNEDIENE